MFPRSSNYPSCALRHGARVTFVHGRDSLTPAACGVDGDSRERVRMIEVETVADLIGTLRAELPGDCDAIVHAMAVLDFEPESAPDEKTSSRRDEWIVRLRPTPKAVAEIRDLAPDAVLLASPHRAEGMISSAPIEAYSCRHSSAVDPLKVETLRELRDRCSLTQQELCRINVGCRRHMY